MNLARYTAADEIKKVVGGIYNGYDHAKEGDD